MFRSYVFGFVLHAYLHDDDDGDDDDDDDDVVELIALIARSIMRHECNLNELCIRKPNMC